jgi:hypothetical protein
VRHPATSSSGQTISPPLNQTATRDAERLDKPWQSQPDERMDPAVAASVIPRRPVMSLRMRSMSSVEGMPGNNGSERRQEGAETLMARATTGPSLRQRHSQSAKDL